MLNSSFKLATLAISTTFLMACGGSSSSSVTSLNGVAVDFYLEGATVKLNECNNHTVVNATNAEGKFDFDLPEGCTNSSLTITEGTDVVTGEKFTGTLFVKRMDFSNTDVVASPLTTLEALLQTAEFQTVLENLGFNKNETVTSFDPVTKGTAKQLATVFLIQQLLTQIEDAIETTNSATDATNLAVQALGNVLKTKKLSDADGKFNLSVLNEIINEAKKAVPSIDTALISNNIGNLATLLNTIDLASLGNGEALVTLLETDTALLDKIKDSIPDSEPSTPTDPKPTDPVTASEITSFKFAGFNISDLLTSSENTPLSVKKSELDRLATMQFGLFNAKDNDIEKAKIILDIVANRNNINKNLNLVFSEVQVTFNALGSIKSFTIPAQKEIKVSSNLAEINTATLSANQDITVTVQNGTINLVDAVNKSVLGQQAYSKYKTLISEGDAIVVNTSVELTNFNLSSSLGLNSNPVKTAKVSSYFKVIN